MTRTSLFPTSFLLVIACCRAAVRCSSSLGGGVCPSDNTCCPVYNANGQLLANASSCIPPNSHIATGPGVCCGRSLSISPWGQPVSTGCPAGYRCASRIDIDGKINEYCSHVGNEEDVDGRRVENCCAEVVTIAAPSVATKQMRFIHHPSLSIICAS